MCGGTLVRPVRSAHGEGDPAEQGGGAHRTQCPSTTLRVVPLPIAFGDREDKIGRPAMCGASGGRRIMTKPRVSAGRAALFLGALLFAPAGAAEPAHRAEVVDAAGNRLVPLAIQEAPAADADAVPTACTADARRCVSLEWGEAGPVLRLTDAEQAVGRMPEFARIPLPPRADGEEARLVLWPALIVEVGGAVVAGVQRLQAAGFSGGGASDSRLVLYRFLPLGAGPLGLELPYSGSASIRACFDEDDVRARAGACADRYELESELTLDPAVAEGRPTLVLTTRARTFPGRRSRTEDSLAGPPLQSSDLVWAEDSTCSYRRRFVFDEADGSYAPDRPLPECADYFGF